MMIKIKVKTRLLNTKTSLIATIVDKKLHLLVKKLVNFNKLVTVKIKKRNNNRKSNYLGQRLCRICKKHLKIKDNQ